MIIENNFVWKCCPVCSSLDISKKRNLLYKGKVNFTSTEVYIKHIPELWLCANCHSFFVQNIFPEDTARYLYCSGCSNERWTSAEFESNKPLTTIRVLTSLFEKHNRVLDIGCNTGELLDYSKKFNCETSGVEFSKSSRKILAKKGHRAYKKILDVTSSFDVIVAFDLIEHLYSVSDFFNDCFRLLSGNGKLVISTGNPHCISARLAQSRWWYWQYPEHIVFPSRFYYKQIVGAKYCKFYRTYASVGHITPVKSRIKIVLQGLVNLNYNGLAAINSDHHLIVFGK